jgi:zinc transporter ZupT
VPIFVAAITVLSTSLGGLFALRHRDRLHLIMGFTAGVLLGLVALDLLPEVYRLSGSTKLFGLPAAAVAFVAGFALLHLVERAVGLHEGHGAEYGEHHHRPVMGLASATTLVVHSFVDGLGIGLAFQGGTALGWAVAIAVIAHDFSDGLNTVTLMLRHGAPARCRLDAAVPDPRAGPRSLPRLLRRVPALPGDRRHPARGPRPPSHTADHAHHRRGADLHRSRGGTVVSGLATGAPPTWAPS